LAIRERLHDQLDMVATFGPADPLVALALPAAVEQHLRSAEGTDLLRRQGSGQVWKKLSPRGLELAIPFVVRREDSDFTVAEHSIRSVELGYPGLPLSVLISRRYVSMMFPHDLFDGTTAWRHIELILARAVGTWRESPLKPQVRRPVLAALRHSGLTSWETLNAARQTRRLAESSTAMHAQFPAGLGIDRARRIAGFRSVVISQEQLAHLDGSTSVRQANSDNPRGRSTRGMKLTELVLDAIDTVVGPASDYRIRMSIDLRRYTPRGARVEGPFSTGYPIGTLRTTDNSAPALTARLAGIVSSKGPLAALVGDVLGLAKTELKHPFRPRRTAPVRTTFDIGVSILPSRIPDAFWAANDADVTGRVSAALLVHPAQPTSPYVQIADVGDDVVVAVWDETGTIDLGEFEAAVFDTLASRVSPSSTNGRIA
jgi:hypothetical protein